MEDIIYPRYLFFTQKQIETLCDVGIAIFKDNVYYIDNIQVIIIPNQIGENS